MKLTAFRTTRYMLVLIAALGAAACSNAGPVSTTGGAVAQAYNTTGVVPTSTYTRTIFTPSNF